MLVLDLVEIFPVSRLKCIKINHRTLQVHANKAFKMVKVGLSIIDLHKDKK
jgi:hypothetical protein